MWNWRNKLKQTHSQHSLIGCTSHVALFQDGISLSASTEGALLLLQIQKDTGQVLVSRNRQQFGQKCRLLWTIIWYNYGTNLRFLTSKIQTTTVLLTLYYLKVIKHVY